MELLKISQRLNSVSHLKGVTPLADEDAVFVVVSVDEDALLVVKRPGLPVLFAPPQADETRMMTTRRHAARENDDDVCTVMFPRELLLRLEEKTAKQATCSPGIYSPWLDGWQVISMAAMPGAISDEAKTFGDNVRAARKEAGFSQEGFAYHCGLDRSYVGQVERGEKNVTLRTIVVLARALKLEPKALLTGI